MKSTLTSNTPEPKAEKEITTATKSIETTQSIDTAEPIEQPAQSPYTSTPVSNYADVLRQDVLGLYAARIAFTLRHNLINLFGYLMYQKQRDIGLKLHYCLNELKQGLQSNAVDVFELIPTLPAMALQKLNQQMLTLLVSLERIAPRNFCMIKCSIREWRKKVETSEMNLIDIVWHFGYNPILHGIIGAGDEEELRRLRNVSGWILHSIQPTNRKEMDILEVFGRSFLKIVREIKSKRFCMSEKLIGYMIAFYPWPLNNRNIEVALSNLKSYFTDEYEHLLRCEIKIMELEELADEPMDMLKKLLSDIENSWCDSNIRVAAAIAHAAMKSKSTSEHYTNIFRRKVFVEPNSVYDLLNIIDCEKYPLEIVLARNRVHKYLQKLIFYINRQKFIAYNYDTLEEALYALLNFILLTTPHAPLEIKQSIKAIRAHLVFYVKPPTISYNLFINVIDGLLAPDLRYDIIKGVIEVKMMALDERQSIMQILQTRHKEKCMELMSCYLKITAMLKNDDRFGPEKAEYLILPANLFQRFIQSQITVIRDADQVDIMSLLDLLNYNDYPREIVLAADKLRDYIKAGAHMLPTFQPGIHCTKQEVLLAYLRQITQLGSLSPEVEHNLQIMIAPLAFITSCKKSVDLTMFSTVLDTWRASETADFLSDEVKRIDEFIAENDKEVEMALTTMDVTLCQTLLDCYNNIGNHLNERGLPYTFITFRVTSPDLSGINLGKLKPMSTQLLLKIVESIHTFDDVDGELEAAISYARDFSDELDKHLADVDCNQLDVINCFQNILDRLRFSPTKLKVNILQFLLMPTTCSSTQCRWIPYEEKGTTILNPLLQYMLYLLEKYKDSLKSLHLRMDIGEIVKYLYRDNINSILADFEIKSISQPVGRISKFIKMLADSNLIEEDVRESIKNVCEYMYSNTLPTKLTVGNLLALHEIFAQPSHNENVVCQMEKAANRISRKRDVISAVLSQIEVDCFTLEQCMNSFEILTTYAYVELAGTPLIMELVKPDVCTPKICPWLQYPLKTKYVSVKTAIRKELEALGLNPKSPLIVRAILGSMKDLARSPNILKNLEMIGEKIINDRRKLQVYLAWLVTRSDTPKRKAVYYDAIAKYLSTGQLPNIINHYCLMYIMKALKLETYDIIISQEIDALLYQLSEMEASTDKWLSKFLVRCDNLDECLYSIYDNIQRLGIADEGIPLHILRLLKAAHCSKVDCPHKMEFTKEERETFMEKGLVFLGQLKNHVDCSYHIQMDIDNVMKMLAGNLIPKVVDTIIYDSSKDRYLNLLKLTISDPECTKELKHAAENIYNYKVHGSTPSYLHFADLIIIADELKLMTVNDEVILQIDDIAEKLLNNRDAVNDLLEKSPVNCTTLESCLNTLTLQMIRRYEHPIVADILNLLEPEPCTDDLCPWTKNSPTKSISDRKSQIYKEIESILKRKDLSLHIRLNLEELYQFFHGAIPSLEYHILRRRKRRNSGDTLLMHLRNLGKRILIERDLEMVKQNIEDFLAYDALPEMIDVKTFVLFGRLLMKTVQDPAIVHEMQHALQNIIAEKHNVNKLMRDCKINCYRVRTCTETILQCTRSNSAEGIHLRNMLTPSLCSRSSCEWMASESRQFLLANLEEVKHDLRVLAKNITSPVIIVIEALDLLSYMKLENVELEVSKLTGQRKKGRLMLRYLSTKKTEPDVSRRASNIYSYCISTTRVPYLAYSDLAGLSTMMAQSATDVNLEASLHSILVKQEVHANETEKALKSCKIKCIDLKQCLVDIKTCFEGSSSQAVRDFISFLGPPQCTIKTCPWMPEGIQTGPDITYPVRTIQPTVLIIFYEDQYDDEIMNHIVLDLTDSDLLDEIEKFTGLQTETRMRITSVTVGEQTINLYFNELEVYKKLVKETQQVVIDLSKNSEFVLCVPVPSEDTRPLKFNIMKAGVRDSLMAIGKQQGPTSTKPKVTFSDYDGKKYDLVVDVLNPNSLMEVMQQTIDDINPGHYWPMSFWPGLSDEKTWRSAVITENGEILRYLTDLAGVDYANKMTPIVLGKDGIVSMDYDPFKRKFRREMDGMFLEVPILKVKEHFQYTFYISHSSEKCCRPIYIDLSKSNVMQGLKAFNSNFSLKGANPTFLVLPGEGEASTFPVYINFYDKDMVEYLIGLNSEPTEEADSTEPEELETPATTLEIIVDVSTSPTPPPIFTEELITTRPFSIVTLPTLGLATTASIKYDTTIIKPEPIELESTESMPAVDVDDYTQEEVLVEVSSEQQPPDIGALSTIEDFIVIPEETSNKPQYTDEGEITVTFEPYPNNSIGQQTTTEDHVIVQEVTSQPANDVWVTTKKLTATTVPSTTKTLSPSTSLKTVETTPAEVATETTSIMPSFFDLTSTSTSETVSESSEIASTVFDIGTSQGATTRTPNAEDISGISTVTTAHIANSINVAEASGTTTGVTANFPAPKVTDIFDSTTKEDIETLELTANSMALSALVTYKSSTEKATIYPIMEMHKSTTESNIPPSNAPGASKATIGPEEPVIIPEVTTSGPVSTSSDTSSTLGVLQSTTVEVSFTMPEVTTHTPMIEFTGFKSTTVASSVETTTEDDLIIIEKFTSKMPAAKVTSKATTEPEETIIILEVTTNIPASKSSEASNTPDLQKLTTVEVSSTMLEVATQTPMIEFSEPESTTVTSPAETTTEQIVEIPVEITEDDYEIMLETDTESEHEHMNATHKPITTSGPIEETKSPGVNFSQTEGEKTTIKDVTEELLTELPDIGIDKVSCDLALIPIANKSDIVVLNLVDPTVINALRDISGKIHYNGPSMVFNVLDFNEDVIPIELNPDDPIVTSMLKTLSENTAVTFKPRTAVTTEQEDIIIVSQVNDLGKAKQIVFEDSELNKKLVIPFHASRGERVENVPFGSGDVSVPIPPGLTTLTDKLVKPRLAAVNYVRCPNQIRKELVLPVYNSGKCYYYFFDARDSKILEALEKLSDKDSTDGTIITFYKSQDKQVHIQLDLTQEDVLVLLHELCIRKELQGDADGAILAVVTANKASIINSFLFDLSNDKVLRALCAMAKNINPTSMSKAVIYYRQRYGKIISITLDYNAYEFRRLKQLERYTSINLKPVFLPNFDSHVPYLAFMIFDNKQGKRSVVLNLGDKATVRKLQRFSRANSYNLPITVRLADNKLLKIYLNKTDPRTIDALIELTNRCPAISLPTQTIQRDGSYKVIVPLRENFKVVVVELDTRKKEVMKTLKDLDSSISFTVPSIMVLNSRNIGEEIRIDNNNQERFDIFLGHASNFKVNLMPQTMIVIWLPNKGFIVLDCSDDVVAKALMKISWHTRKRQTYEHIIFQNSNRMIVSIHLSLKSETVIEKLSHLASMISENRNPMTIMVRPGRKILVFTILNANVVKPVILDLTNKRVINGLIAVSNPHNGIAIDLIDARNNSLVIRIDTSNSKVVWTLMELTKLTKPLPPFVYPPYTPALPELRIPVIDHVTNITVLQICNMSDPIVLDKFLKIPGKNTKGLNPGAAFPLINSEKENAIAFLDLSDVLVTKKIQEVCPNYVTVVHPGKILLLVLKNSYGKYDYVLLNILNDSVLTELKKLSNKAYDAPDLQKYQILDSDGNVCTIELNLQNDVVQEKLRELSKISAIGGSGNFIISNELQEYLVIIIANYDKPIIIPIDQVKEVEQEIDEIKKLVEEGKISEAIVIEEGLPQKFYEVQLVPGSTFAQGKIQIACLNNKNQNIRLTLNLRKRNVILAIKQAVEISDKHRPRLAIKLVRNGKITTYRLDNMNSKVCNLLKRYCDDYYFCPKENSLLMMEVMGHANESKRIILDLSNQKVLDELQSMAKKTNLSEVTQVGIHMAGGHIIPFKLNTQNERVSKKLISLATLTPAPTTPTFAINPNGKLPYVVFTLKSRKGLKSHFVLDLSSNIVRLKLTTITSPKPKQPYLILYKHGNKKTHKWLLDLNWKTVAVLQNLTKLHSSMPTDAFLNVPTKSAVLVEKAIVPTEDAKGNVVYQVLDLTSRKVKLILSMMKRNMTKSTPAMVVYTKDSNGHTSVWRINIKQFRDYVNGNSSKIHSAYLHPTAVLIVTFMDAVGELRPVILDVFRTQVDDVLKALSKKTPDDSGYSLVILDTFTEVDAIIRLDLKNLSVQGALLELQESTPQPLVPIVIASPSRGTHLVVLTIQGSNNRTTPIILDMRNEQVIDALEKISRPADKNSFPINVSNAKGKKKNVYINVYRKRTREKLQRISRHCPFFKAPVTLQKHELKTIPMRDVDGQTILLKIDTSDPHVINKLMKMSHNTPDDQANLWFNTLDSYGNTVTIQLDRNDKGTRDKLAKINKKAITTEGPLVIPPTGTQPLITITLKIQTCSSFFTLDPNLHSVITTLKRISTGSNRGKHVQQLKIVDKDMKEFIVYIDPSKEEVVRKLYEASQLSDIQTSPPIVTPHRGADPLIHFVAKRSNNRKVSFTIDLNNRKIVKALKKVSLSEPTGTYVFSEDIYLNMSDERTLNVLAGVTAKSDIKLVPNAQRLPIVQLGDDIRLNLCSTKVVTALIGLNEKDEQKENVTQIAVTTINGLKKIVNLELSNGKVQVILKEITAFTPMPTVIVNTREWTQQIQILPITMMGINAIHPLLLATHPTLGHVTIDLNDKTFVEELSKIKLNSNYKGPSIEIGGAVDADINKINFDAENKETIKLVQHLNQISKVSFDTSSGCWLPTMKFKKRDGGLLVLDLANATVVTILQNVSVSDNSNPYILQMPAAQGYKLLRIDPDNVELQRRLLSSEHVPDGRLEDEKKLSWASFEIKYAGKIHTYTVDINNSEMMRKLGYYSKHTKSYARRKSVLIPKINQKFHLDMSCAKCKGLLEEITVKTTGKSPAIKPISAKNLHTLKFYNNYGRISQIVLNLNNAQVMDDLDHLSATYQAGLKELKTKIKMVNGTEVEYFFDIGDPATIDKLRCIERNSLSSIACRIDRGKDKAKTLRFDIVTDELGKLQIMINPNNPIVLQKLLDTSKMIKETRAAETITFTNPVDGLIYKFSFDPRDPQVVYHLLVLTKMSTGAYPLTYTDQLIRDLLKLPSYVTIEVDNGYETSSLTLDKQEWHVETVNSIDVESQGQGVIEIYKREKNQTIKLDLQDGSTMETLMTVSIPTACIKRAEKVDLHTVFIVKWRDSITVIHLNLGEKRTVLAFLKIVGKYASEQKTGYAQLRDDNGQYVTVEINLENLEFLSELSTLSACNKHVAIDGRLSPYLVISTPTENSAIKVKLTAMNVKRMAKLTSGTKPLKLSIQASNSRFYDVKIDFYNTRLFKKLSKLFDSSWISSRPSDNVFVAYIWEGKSVNGVYLDMTNANAYRTLNAIHKEYSSADHLTVIKCWSNTKFPVYFTVNLNNQIAFERLKSVSLYVSGQSLLKTKIKHKQGKQKKRTKSMMLGPCYDKNIKKDLRSMFFEYGCV